MTTDAQTQVLVLLAHLVEERSGIHTPNNDLGILSVKIETHAEDQGFSSLLDFYYALRYDDPSLARTNTLIDALIVGETYFFRERSGLERIVEHVAKRFAADRPSRIWSAACATGEEPLSLAILLAQGGLLDRTAIVATDISSRQIARARRGEHSRRALRTMPDGMSPWLRAEQGAAVVDPAIRDRIDWRVLNLVDGREVEPLGTFDAVLCRNVLIYFHDATVRRAAALLAGALAPDGILLISAAESLLRHGTVLECIERNGTFLYQRASP